MYLIRNTQHRDLDGFHSIQVPPKSSQYRKHDQIQGLLSGHCGIPAPSQLSHWGSLAAVLKAASRLLQTVLKTKPVSEQFQNMSWAKVVCCTLLDVEQAGAELHLRTECLSPANTRAPTYHTLNANQGWGTQGTRNLLKIVSSYTALLQSLIRIPQKKFYYRGISMAEDNLLR